MRGTANNTSTAKLTSLTDVSLLLRSSLGAAFVTQARMVSRPMQRQDCTLRPVVLRTDLPSPIIPCCYLLLCPKTTLCSRSELNFAVAIYPQDRSHAGTLSAWFRARQHSNNGFGGSSIFSLHVVQGPETASQSVAVEGIHSIWECTVLTHESTYSFIGRISVASMFTLRPDTEYAGLLLEMEVRAELERCFEGKVI